MNNPPSKIVPASVLTGFLGAGKTTLLNHILREQSRYKFAVIVNELGAVGIDGQLVENQRDEVVELSNGCVCCTVRKDLVDALGRVLARGGFDYLLIETTGIADPGPIVQTFVNLPALARLVQLDAVITVVDAEQVLGQLAEIPVATEQIALADFVLLNKVDLVDDAAREQVTARVRELNPHARILPCSRGQVPLDDLLDIHAFNVDEKLTAHPQLRQEPPAAGPAPDRSEHGHESAHEHEHGPEHGHEHEPGHDHHHPASPVAGRTAPHPSHEEIESFSFTFEQPFEAGRFERFVQELGESARVYRSKGIVAIQGHPERGIFHGVNNRFHLFWDRPWGPGEQPSSQVVFIGRDLDPARIEAGLRRCLVSGEKKGWFARRP